MKAYLARASVWAGLFLLFGIPAKADTVGTLAFSNCGGDGSSDCPAAPYSFDNSSTSPAFDFTGTVNPSNYDKTAWGFTDSGSIFSASDVPTGDGHQSNYWPKNPGLTLDGSDKSDRGGKGTPTPEPGSLALLGSGMLTLAVLVRHRLTPKG